ncbi:unnamed protein product [Pseudo-nitzschia multistriata]|uniref:Mitochondrial carrier protein n=1 Tax=Pseudo-nitzschia multistriata TaxID=183589 RepID=A0A448ZJM8_9STRA|nr:unnamed protein product [Pseudo-nitzschia multistriata]
MKDSPPSPSSSPSLPVPHHGNDGNGIDNDNSDDRWKRRGGLRPRFTRRRQSTTIVRRSTIVEAPGKDAWGLDETTEQHDGDPQQQQQQQQYFQQQQQQQEECEEAVGPVSFLCGITAGVLQAGLFNPFDRALYLSITNEVPFLRRENFRNPYTGFLQSVGHRALSGGLYYPLENFFCGALLGAHSHPQPHEEHASIHHHHHHAAPHSHSHSHSQPHPPEGHLPLHPAFANFLAGTLAGTTNAMIVNPITAIKYKTWGREVNRGMATEVVEMFRKGGFRPFRNGLVPTVLRDLCFGGTYTFLRLEIQYVFQLRPDQQWGANTVAASLATIVSAPFNLVRNVQYATRSRERADGVAKILGDFAREVASQATTWRSLRYFQTRLRIGWGTVRVGVGMAFGHSVYDRLMGAYHELDRGKRSGT